MSYSRQLVTYQVKRIKGISNRIPNGQQLELHFPNAQLTLHSTNLFCSFKNLECKRKKIHLMNKIGWLNSQIHSKDQTYYNSDKKWGDAHEPQLRSYTLLISSGSGSISSFKCVDFVRSNMLLLVQPHLEAYEIQVNVHGLIVKLKSGGVQKVGNMRI